MVTLHRITGDEPPLRAGLAELLLDAVRHGASVGFLDSLTRTSAEHYWGGVLAGLGADFALWVARLDGRVVGTVQLARCARDNGRHRGDLQKLLVHSGSRGRGIATRLVEEADAWARGQGLTLLVLDTHAGSDAERLYRRLGWRKVGEIPRYAGIPDGTLIATAYYYKPLDA